MDPIASGTAAELALWRDLTMRALRRGVPYADAQDLAGQAILKALEAYAPERGGFAPFCGTIHANLLRNWWRDRKPSEPWDEQAHDLPGPDDPHAAVADEEERAMYAQISERILAALEPDEAALFLILGEQCREAERAAVSAAARRLGIAPLKAWDLFRRIRRKARPMLAEFVAVQAMPAMRAEEPRVEHEAPELAEEEIDLSQTFSALGAPAWVPRRLRLGHLMDRVLGLPSPLARVAAGADAGFGAFAARLAPEQRARLSACLS